MSESISHKTELREKVNDIIKHGDPALRGWFCDIISEFHKLALSETNTGPIPKIYKNVWRKCRQRSPGVQAGKKGRIKLVYLISFAWVASLAIALFIICKRV